tara:strand:- start:180 stop:1118 length:939 start_codon:yes stop_codon:yes gene_type:complete
MIAVIGCGYWGRNLIKNFHDLSSLSCVYDLDKNLQNKFSKKYKINELSWKEILESKKIKGCVVSTNAETHYSIVKELINNGKNVFVEKPICLDIEEAKELNRLSKENGSVLMVGHLLRYHDHFKRLEKLIKENGFGEIKKIRSTRKSFGKLRFNEDVIWSFAPHDISMCIALTGNGIRDLKVLRKKFFSGITDSANISFSSGNIPIEIDVDWTSYEKLHRFEVYMEKGIVVFEDSASESNKKLFQIKMGFNQENLTRKQDLEKEYITDFSYSEPLKNECKHFLDCIQNKTEPITNANEAIEVLKVLVECEKN